MIDENVMQLGVNLATILAKNTASMVTDKVTQIKENRNKDEQIAQYEQIITDLIDDKSGLTRIALSYKDELEKITISDEDIKSLHNTLSKILNLVPNFNNQTTESKDSLNLLINLIDADTLKTMQILGYNYKEAIGVPLTLATAEFIEQSLKVKKNTNNGNRKE
ncbi:hypothetical protein [Lactococcus lactis]|uniref:hypothetical protein n=1 Tax=Lactococcus lactis TaxID=1358 RepID=UPI000C9F40F5|nr:hypothetical protein [Lactococcus lactis]AUS70617.1 hypothetical protein LLG50_11300 [Lactococcus lactis subsp. lactis]